MGSFFQKFGVISACLVTYHFARILSKYVYKIAVLPHLTKTQLRDFGQWAVVVGASDGFGRAYAEALAKEGLNIFLIGNDLMKLMSASQQIEDNFHVLTGAIVLDSSSINAFRHIESLLENLDVGILVNAPGLGLGYPYPDRFLDLPYRSTIFTGIMQNNIVAVTKMCELVLPGMVERGRGIIINVSSMAAKVPCPLLSVYGASAAYIEKLSEELRHEYSSNGIIIQTLIPGYIMKNRHHKLQKNWMTPTYTEYVADAMKTIGVDDVTCGYAPHTVLHGFIDTFRLVFPTMTVSIIRRLMEIISLRIKKERIQFRCRNV